MTHATSTLAGAGGGQIFWQSWTPEETPARGVVVVVHGFGEHSNRYEHVAERLVAEGHVTYALDHRGHGRSDGTRAVIDRLADAVSDIDQLVVLAGDAHPGLPVFMLGHSMGGLLARSAVHYGLRAGHRWPQRLSDMVFLGTPHHGAPLERAGHWVDVVLGATHYAAPFARLGKVRSAGITDLRHGNLVDEDWVGRDRFARGSDRRQHVPLPGTVRCYAVAASVGQRGGDLKDRLLGDGLVPLDSALGRHQDAARTLPFAEDRQWIGYGINHLELLNRAAVYARIRQWLTNV